MLQKIAVSFTLLFSVHFLFSQSLIQSISGAHPGGVNKVTSSINSNYLLTIGKDKRSVLWKKEGLKKAKIFSGFSSESKNVAYNVSGTNFLTETSSKKLVLWNPNTLKPLKVFSNGVSDRIELLTAHPNGQSYLGVTNKNRLLSWGLSGNLLVDKVIDTKRIKDISFFNDAKEAILFTQEGKVIRFNLITKQEEEIDVSSSSFTVGVKNPVKDYIFILSEKELFKLNSTGDFTSIKKIDKGQSICFSPDGQYFWVGTSSGSLITFSEDGKQIQKQSAHQGAVNSIVCELSKLYTAGSDGALNAWDISQFGIAGGQLIAANSSGMRGVTMLAPTNTNTGLNFGKYYALIIGIDQYQGAWSPLQNAVNDAQALSNLLGSTYKFDEVKTLYNSNATRVNIIQQLEWLVKTVLENDNVLIYYSGHGDFNKPLNKGYWVPVDAKTTSTSYYISNSDLQTYIGGIKAKHTLLVSDACFSGDIFRGGTEKIEREDNSKYYTKVHNLNSRRAITSGGLEPVMDGGKDGHSVFAYYFLKALSNNQSEYLDADALFENLKVPVINNSDQVPNYNPIKNTGDEGGQFIFLRK